MKRHARGLTLVELITVVAIIAILVALLVPAVNMARRFAKDTQQKAQLNAMSTGLETFKNDFGDYPPSNPSRGVTPYDPCDMAPTYCGAQKLAEALVGRDMRGFNPAAYADMVTTSGLDKTRTSFYPDLSLLTEVEARTHLAGRKALYLEAGTANAFRLRNISLLQPGLYANVGVLAPDSFVLCDVYGKKTMQFQEGTVTKEVRLGSPILYTRANAAEKVSGRIYNYYDNYGLIRAKELNDQAYGEWGDTPSQGTNGIDNFYAFIRDPRVTPTNNTSPALGMPYRSDSYILVSAGQDGKYGTTDDICNFAR